MRKEDIEFADYYIGELLKVYPKSISPSYKKYKNAYWVIKELKEKRIIEREQSNSVGFKISPIYVDGLREFDSYSEWLLRDETISFPNISPHTEINISVNPEPINKPPSKKSALVRLFNNSWFRGISIATIPLVIEEIKLGIIWKFIMGLF